MKMNYLNKTLRKSRWGLSLRRAKLRLFAFLHDTRGLPVMALRNAVRAERLPRLRSSTFPPIIHVETTNACNGGCVMCAHTTSMTRNIQTMPEILYNKIIDECASYTDKIEEFWIFMLGEPLLDKNIGKRISHAKERGINNVGFFTNASLLKGDKAREILESGIDHITISIDGLTPETFEKIRPGLKYHEIMENIHQFMELKRKKRVKKPVVAVEYIEMPLNKDETLDFVNRWERIVDFVYISSHVNWGDAIPEGRSFSMPLYKKRKPCYRIFRDMVINVDGRVSLCCYDYDIKEKMGDVSVDSIRAVWQGERFREIRRLHLLHQYGKIPLCQGCDVWRSPSDPWWF